MFDVDRVLAIPEFDLDHVQMGLSNNAWAVVKATGKTKDGEAAKPSVLKQTRKGVSQEDIEKAAKGSIKGDKKLSEVQAKSSNRGLEVTYNKQGDLSSAATATKAKKAISGQAKGGKVVKPSLNPNEWGKDYDKNAKIVEMLAQKLGLPVKGAEAVKLLRGREGDFNSLKGTKYVKAGVRTLTPRGQTELDSIKKDLRFSIDDAIKTKERYSDIKGAKFDAKTEDILNRAKIANDLSEAIGQKAPYPKLKKLALNDDSRHTYGRYLNDADFVLTKSGESMISKLKDNFNKSVGRQSRKVIKGKSPRDRKQPSPVAKKLGISAEQEADILKRLKKY